MTLDELIARVRKAPGRTIHTKVAAVVDEIGGNGELQDAWQALAPWALLEYDRRTLRKEARPIIPIADGERKDPWKWTRADVLTVQARTGKAGHTMIRFAKVLGKIAAAFKNDRETMKDIHARLDPATWQAFAKWAGIKMLGA